MSGAAKHVSATELNRTLGAVMDRVRTHKETVIVCNHGRPQLAVIPMDEYEALIEERRQLNWLLLARDFPAAVKAEMEQ